MSIPIFPPDFANAPQTFTYYLPVNSEHLENRRELVGRRGKRELSLTKMARNKKNGALEEAKKRTLLKGKKVVNSQFKKVCKFVSG